MNREAVLRVWNWWPLMWRSTHLAIVHREAWKHAQCHARWLFDEYRKQLQENQNRDAALRKLWKRYRALKAQRQPSGEKERL